MEVIPRPVSPLAVLAWAAELKARRNAARRTDWEYHRGSIFYTDAVRRRIGSSSDSWRDFKNAGGYDPAG